MKQIKEFAPYKRETELIFSKDEQGLRINGYLVAIKKNNGVVSIENYSVGLGHSCHPNIDCSGSVKGMKLLGYWKKEDKTVKAGGHIYNLSSIVISDPLDLLAYYIEVKGYQIDPNVIEKCGNPLWAGISVILPKLDPIN